jgi:hypothetical protein
MWIVQMTCESIITGLHPKSRIGQRMAPCQPVRSFQSGPEYRYCLLTIVYFPEKLYIAGRMSLNSGYQSAGSLYSKNDLKSFKTGLHETNSFF